MYVFVLSVKLAIRYSKPLSHHAWLETLKKTQDIAEGGDGVKVPLRGIQKEDARNGMVLARALSISTCPKSEGEKYVLLETEAGTKARFFEEYKPRFQFYTTDLNLEQSLSSQQWFEYVKVFIDLTFVKLS